MSNILTRVSETFHASNAPMSRQLCKELESKGPIGQLAAMLFKAEKANMQAKSYLGRSPVSGRPYRGYSFDRMREMLAKAIRLLDAHAKAMGTPWSWHREDKPGGPFWSLTIDLPTGRVAYRMPYLYAETESNSGVEDDAENSDQVTEFCAGVLDGLWALPKQIRHESTDTRRRANRPCDVDSPLSVCEHEPEED